MAKAMATVIYAGDHAAVLVPLSAHTYLEATKGEPVEVDAELAERLCESPAWKAAGTKPAASTKAKAAKPEPEAEEA